MADTRQTWHCAAIATLTSCDRRLARFVGRWARPAWCERIFDALGLLGDGWHLVLTTLALGFAAQRAAQALAASLLAAALSCLVVIALKQRFPRARPCSGPVNSFYRFGRPGALACDDHSFPSGHAASASALATVLGLAYPATAPLLAALAAAIATGRLFKRLHWLSDVVAGLALGTLFGALSGSLVLR